MPKKLSAKFLRELRQLEAEVGKDGVWKMAEEAEKNRPKPGPKPGPIYEVERAVDRMLSLRATRSRLSLRGAAQLASEEFGIGAETLRDAERERRKAQSTVVSASPEVAVPKPSRPAERQVAAEVPPAGSGALREQDFAWVRDVLAPIGSQAALNIVWEGDRKPVLDEIMRQSSAAMAEWTERNRMIAEQAIRESRVVQELVSFQNWRDILGKN